MTTNLWTKVGDTSGKLFPMGTRRIVQAEIREDSNGQFYVNAQTPTNAYVGSVFSSVAEAALKTQGLKTDVRQSLLNTMTYVSPILEKKVRTNASAPVEMSASEGTVTLPEANAEDSKPNKRSKKS